jgi:peptidoglycan/xylan/chitin deacetylase (PgdA/CDA1 family)
MARVQLWRDLGGGEFAALGSSRDHGVFGAEPGVSFCCEDQRMTLKRPKRNIPAVMIRAMFVGGLLTLLSCATKTSTPNFFQSNEYIIYRLQEKETSAALAKRFLGDKQKLWVIEDANGKSGFKKNEVVVIPLKEENIGGVTMNGFQVVPILSYHHFAEDCNSPLCTRAGGFDRQMEYLKKNGYRVISMRELLGFLNYSRPLPRNSVVISIDDGYRSVYDIAFPILEKYGFTATLFIYTDFVGASRNALSWDQLREMKAAGFEVGSHSLSHADLTLKLDGEEDATYISRIERELLLSKEIIDKKLQQNTIILAFPFGRYDSRTLAICERLGYKIGTSVMSGSNPFFADPLALRRNQVLSDDLSDFISKVKTFEKF